MTQAFNLSQFANKVNTSGQADLTTAVSGVLPVANGGTGLSSPGASGNVLQSNGSAWTSATIAIFSGNAGQAFTTVGSGQTFTIPSGITKLKITVQAGGGNGGNASNFGTAAGGGGGGAAIKFLTGVTPGNTLSITVGGAVGASSVASGTQTITTISATSGSTAGSAGEIGAVNGAAGGIGSGGDLNIKGSGGGSALSGKWTDVGWLQLGGAGGASYLGGGGQGLASFGGTQTGVAGGAYGGGGSGGMRTGTTGGAGGAGSQGCVLIEW